MTVAKHLTETTQWGRVYFLVSEIMAGRVWCSREDHIMVPKKQREETGRYRQDTPRNPQPRDLIPSARCHLLKLLEPPKMVPPAGTKGLTLESGGGHFIFKP
jgi:hypothetical protein